MGIYLFKVSFFTLALQIKSNASQKGIKFNNKERFVVIKGQTLQVQPEILYHFEMRYTL